MNPYINNVNWWFIKRLPVISYPDLTFRHSRTDWDLGTRLGYHSNEEVLKLHFRASRVKISLRGGGGGCSQTTGQLRLRRSHLNTICLALLKVCRATALLMPRITGILTSTIVQRDDNRMTTKRDVLAFMFLLKCFPYLLWSNVQQKSFKWYSIYNLLILKRHLFDTIDHDILLRFQELCGFKDGAY